MIRFFVENLKTFLTKIQKYSWLCCRARRWWSNWTPVRRGSPSPATSPWRTGWSGPSTGEKVVAGNSLQSCNPVVTTPGWCSRPSRRSARGSPRATAAAGEVETYRIAHQRSVFSCGDISKELPRVKSWQLII